MAKKFAVFDIDGTLIRWQLYHALVDRLAKYRLLGHDAQDQLHVARMAWKNRVNSEAFRQYELALISVYESTIKDIDVQRFDEIAEEVAREYKDQVHTYTRDLIISLKKKDYLILAISGSQTEIVAHIAKNHGFDDWVGTEYFRKDDRFTGEKFVASHHKQKVLKELVKKYGLSYEDSYAIGDSGGDIPMLEMVQNPIAFNPDQTLFDSAKEHGWKVVVERKNVIYQLIPGYTGNYELTT